MVDYVKMLLHVDINVFVRLDIQDRNAISQLIIVPQIHAHSVPVFVLIQILATHVLVLRATLALNVKLQ